MKPLGFRQESLKVVIEKETLFCSTRRLAVILKHMEENNF